MHDQIFLGLGSNLGNSVQLVHDAVDAIAANDNNHLVAMSSLYQSSPMGPKEQPDYINAVCQINTSLTPQALLSFCQEIEDRFGRVRDVAERWGPRTLDIDIILFGIQQVKTPDLLIPHPGIAEREFVLVPLFELAPALVMPDGYPLAKWVAACSLEGLKRIRQS